MQNVVIAKGRKLTGLGRWMAQGSNTCCTNMSSCDSQNTQKVRHGAARLWPHLQPQYFSEEMGEGGRWWVKL